MKKFLFAVTMLAFAVSAVPHARGDDVSIDFIYDNLSGGNWIDVEGYGYGWQPDVVVRDPNWRPYSDGYWAYTDYGWTWVSYEDFGWATYHYGRWANLADYGWVWFPGEDLDWGPAWVSWRTGGDYVGWAPLPPRGPGVVYGGRPIGPQVDIEFDIGPQYYNFIPVRYVGEPVLRNYIVPPVQNVTYINNTVNITNITVRNNVVYNYGPNYEVLSAASARPIQRLNIERQSAANLSEAAKSGALTKVQGNKLVVAAPRRLAKAPPAARPPTVKTKVAQPKLNRGWAGVANEAQIKQKIKTENPKNVPPPTRAATGAAGSPPPEGPGAAESSPAAPPRAATPRAPAPRATPPARGTPPGRPCTTPPTKASPAPGAPGRTLERGRPTPPPRFTPQRAPGAPASPAGIERKPPAAGPPSPRHTPPSRPEAQPQPPGGERGRIEGGGTPPPTGPGAGERRGATARGQPPSYGRPGTPSGGAGPGETRGGRERGQPDALKPPTTPPAGGGQGEARGGRERGQGAYGQPGGQPRGGAPAASEQGQGKPERGKKKGEGPPPPRGPQ